MIKRYEGEKVILTPLVTTQDALEKYLVWMNDTSFNHFISKAHTVTTIETMREWAAEKALQKEKLYFSIYPKDELNLIGTCSIGKKGDTNGCLGICIGEKGYQEHGYGTDAMRTLVKFGFEELGLHRLSLTLDADNKRAHSCYESVGFVDCGREHEVYWYHNGWHDVITMEFLYSDYEPRGVR